MTDRHGAQQRIVVAWERCRRSLHAVHAPGAPDPGHAYPQPLSQIELGRRADLVVAFGDNRIEHLLALHDIDPDHSRRR